MDMVEMGVSSLRRLHEVAPATGARTRKMGSRPAMVFAGPVWDTERMSKLKHCGWNK